MMIWRVLVSLFAATCFATTGLAADLTKVDRTLIKEPAYRSQPRYCLLVFGPEAATRVWLIHDGKILATIGNGRVLLWDLSDLIGEGSVK